MPIVTVALGLILLVFGRNVFWLGVAVLGFFLGMAVAGTLLADQPQWVILLMGVAAGLLGALVAVLTQRVAFALAGGYAGAYLALMAARSFGVGGPSALWWVTGGVLGAVLTTLVLDWAIIALTSAVGAAAIVDAGGLGPTPAGLLFVVLTAVGVVMQARRMGPRRAKGPRSAQ